MAHILVPAKSPEDRKDLLVRMAIGNWDIRYDPSAIVTERKRYWLV
jgi:hypothetical protein